MPRVLGAASRGSGLGAGEAAVGRRHLPAAGRWHLGRLQALGTDLLPEMDEGGFILDYIMPAGSSLTETNRVLEHVERILRSYARSGNHFAPHRACRWAWPP